MIKKISFMFFILMIIVITIIGLKYINSEHLDEKNEKFLWYYDINSSYHLCKNTAYRIVERY